MAGVKILPRIDANAIPRGFPEKGDPLIWTAPNPLRGPDDPKLWRTYALKLWRILVGNALEESQAANPLEDFCTRKHDPKYIFASSIRTLFFPA